MKTVIVVKRTGGAIKWVEGRDVWFEEAVAQASADWPRGRDERGRSPVHSLHFRLDGMPKGVLHTTGEAISSNASMTHQYVFDYHDGDIYWCTADVGWVTGHSYIVYGPLANGATTLMFEGVPNYPSVSRFWDVIDKHQVNIFYTAPTAIRALMGAGDEPVRKTSPRESAAAWLGRRADQSGSLDLVLSCGRRRPLPDRRHLVADGKPAG